jgi:ATP synthase protein I
VAGHGRDFLDCIFAWEVIAMIYSFVVREVDVTSMKNGNKKYPDANDYSAFALVGQVGLYIAGGALLGLAAGSFIDGKLHSAPVATLIGLLLGLAVGIYGVFRLVSSLK